MSLSPSRFSSYSSRVQKILRRLQRGYGDDAAVLALQALELFAQTPSKHAAPSQPVTLSEVAQSVLKTAYDRCCQQTGAEWVHHAMFYAAVRTVDPTFSHKPTYKIWPKFLLAYPWLFESQVLREQLYIRLRSPQKKTTS